MHRKSASNVQKSSLYGAGKSSEALANLTTKYNVPYKKSEVPQTKGLPKSETKELNGTFDKTSKKKVNYSIESFSNNTTGIKISKLILPINLLIR